jgi:hypothetical protein
LDGPIRDALFLCDQRMTMNADFVPAFLVASPNTGLLEGKAEPEPARIVDIATRAALVEMIVPGLIAVFCQRPTPITQF